MVYLHLPNTLPLLDSPPDHRPSSFSFQDEDDGDRVVVKQCQVPNPSIFISPYASPTSQNLQHVTHKNLVSSRPVDISYPEKSQELLKDRINQKRSFSVKENLLAQAWERKRDHMLRGDELISNTKSKLDEVAMVEQAPVLTKLYGRDESPCLHSDQASDAKTRPMTCQRSLTDDDFDELRGFIDLGFRFSPANCNPDLCVTLPALQIYYAVSQKLHDSEVHPSSPVSTLDQCFSEGQLESPTSSISQSPTASWSITRPGDEPEAVKVRLRQWARAVACTVRQSC